MAIWLWISGIVILIFIAIFIIALLPDNVLERTSVGRVLQNAKNCCKRAFQREKKDEYGLGFLRK